MKYNISDYKLRIIVDQLGEEYKDLLVERTLDDINEIDTDLINPSDLIRLDVSAKSNLRIGKQMQRKNRMFSIISLLGITYALFGLLLMMWSELRNSILHDSMMMVSFLLIFIGLFVALFSLLSKNMLSMRPQYYGGRNRKIYPYEVVNKWKEVEALIYELTPKEKALSLFSMVTYLKDTKIISEQDIETINRLLNIRNQIVHGLDNERDLSQAELCTILLQADRIISKMKKLV